MSDVRLIDANALKYKNLAEVNGRLTYVLTPEEIDNAPIVETSKIEYKAYNEGFKDGVEQGIRLSDRPQGKRSRYKRRCGMTNEQAIRWLKALKANEIVSGAREALDIAIKALEEESPAGRYKSCKYYHPYYEQLTNIPRGDGYCVIARMTPEGMTTINCNDEFGCSDYEKGGAE